MLVGIASIISKQISTGKSLDLQRGFARIGRSDANIIAWIWGLSEGHVFLTSASGRLFYMSYEDAESVIPHGGLRHGKSLKQEQRFSHGAQEPENGSTRLEQDDFEKSQDDLQTND